MPQSSSPPTSPTSNPYSPSYIPPPPLTNNPLPKVKATVLKGLGRSAHGTDTTQPQASSSSSLKRILSSTIENKLSRIPGHLETDYGDMTAEWEPNPVKKN